MLKTIARVVLALQGATSLFIAANVWMDPATLAAQLGISPIGDLGVSTIRGDIGGFFSAVGVFMLAAAYFGDRRFIVPPLVLGALALTGRTISLAVTGPAPELFQPMLIEAVTIIVLVTAYAVFAREA